jgi:flagellar assembly protein FliH
MKATLIPKELLTAYERWEMESFDDKPPVPDAPAAPQLTPEDVLRIKERAWQEGYEAGMEQGYQNGQQQGYDEGLNKGYQESQLQGWEYGHTSGMDKGLTDGHAEGYGNGLATGHKEGYETGYSKGKAEIDELTQRLQALATSFTNEVTQASEAMAAPMLALATDMCKAMLKTALQIKPDLIIPLIRDAIASLPDMQTPASLHLHPDDANLVRTQMQEDIAQHGWKIVETPDISRGGCKIETGSNQIDATVETRWKHLAETLHQQSDWLA